MKIKTLKNTKTETSIELSEVTPTLINSIRRSILKKVNTLAIDDIYITENNSGIYDEVLAQPIGLIALHTPTNLIKVSECNHKGVESCEK